MECGRHAENAVERPPRLRLDLVQARALESLPTEVRGDLGDRFRVLDHPCLVVVETADRADHLPCDAQRDCDGGPGVRREHDGVRIRLLEARAVAHDDPVAAGGRTGDGARAVNGM